MGQALSKNIEVGYGEPKSRLMEVSCDLPWTSNHAQIILPDHTQLKSDGSRIRVRIWLTADSTKVCRFFRLTFYKKKSNKRGPLGQLERMKLADARWVGKCYAYPPCPFAAQRP